MFTAWEKTEDIYGSIKNGCGNVDNFVFILEEELINQFKSKPSHADL